MTVEFTGIRVNRNLEVELAYADGATTPAEQAPVLSGVEVPCTDKSKKTASSHSCVIVANCTDGYLPP